jgi:hypothetical protein
MTRRPRALLVATLLPGLACLAGVATSAGCGGGGGGGGGAPPAFRVTSMVPADGAVNVKTNTSVVVTFSQSVDPSSVKTESLRIARFGAGGEVFGDVAVVPDTEDRQIRFVPDVALEDLTIYSVVVSPRLESASGEEIGGDTTFSFRTEGTVGLPQQSDLRPTANRLDTGRRNHTATLLADGRVLIAGGYIQGTTVTDRAEVFHPASDLFSSLSERMVQPRTGHTATLLVDGRVLLVGGAYEVSTGTLNTAITAEVYDPSTASFFPTGDLGYPREDQAAALLPDGRVLVTGGSRRVGSGFEDLDDAEVWDPATGAWSAWPSLMVHHRATHGMVDLGDGRFFLAGGSTTDLRAEVLSLGTGTFAPVPAAVDDHGRFGPALARFADGDVLVVGGDSVGTILYFDREASTQRNTGSGTSRPRAYATATPVGPDRVLVVGGLDFSAGGFVLSTTDLVVQGGPGGSRTYLTPMRFPTGIANHTATRLADGRVLYAGGLNPQGGLPELDGGYVYTP